MIFTLKRIYEGVLSWFAQVFQTVLTLFKIPLMSRIVSPLPAFEAKSMLVLGNGPSLNEALENNAQAFKNHQLWVVNHFAVSSYFEQLKPTCYVMLDAAFWQGMDNQKGMPIAVKTWETLIQKVQWPLHLYIPVQGKSSQFIQSVSQQNPNIQLHFFNYTVASGFDTFIFPLFNVGLVHPQSQNVLVSAIFLGIRSGFTHIKILGADHDWHLHLHINEHNELCVRDRHFYDTDGAPRYVKFHKHGEGSPLFTMREIFTTWAKVFAGYEYIQRYARYKGVRIVNASSSSFIDTFEREAL